MGTRVVYPACTQQEQRGEVIASLCPGRAERRNHRLVMPARRRRRASSPRYAGQEKEKRLIVSLCRQEEEKRLLASLCPQEET